MKGEILHTARTFDKPGEIGYIYDSVGASPPVRNMWLIAWQLGRSGGLCFEIGEAENEIEDVAAVQKALNPLFAPGDKNEPPFKIFGSVIKQKFSPSLGSPPECKITNSGEPPLCKFGPGGRYTTDYYAPRQRRIAPRRVRAWLTRILARLRTVFDN